MTCWHGVILLTFIAIWTTGCGRQDPTHVDIDIANHPEVVRIAREAVRRDIDLPSDEFIRIEDGGEVWVITWLLAAKTDGPDAGYVAKVKVEKRSKKVVAALVGS
jgi:hypothetical protein